MISVPLHDRIKFRHHLAAYKLNKTREFDPQPPVYAVLTDLRVFQFYRYDGTQFFVDDDIYVTSKSRSQFLNGMSDGIYICSFINAEIEPLE